MFEQAVKKSDTQRLREILADPVLWGERVLKNRDGSRRSYWQHQIEDMHAPDKFVVHLDGRDTGKSISISTQALHFCFTTAGGQGLIAAPLQGQLDTIIEEIEFQIEKSEPLAQSLATNRWGQPKITRKPYYKIEFKNGSVLYFRPGGAYGDAFRSLHVNRIWVDEGAFLTEKGWKALRQCLKTGGRMQVYSTPNGIRDTTYYRLTTTAKGWRVFHWPSWLNPGWNQEREDELLEFYGGRDSHGWQHEVEGKHGKPAYGAFLADQLAASIVSIPEYRSVHITGEEMAGCASEQEYLDRFEMLINLMPMQGRFWLGGDTGYTSDPTELMVFSDYETEEGKSYLTCVLRIHMEHVPYPLIAQCISLLDRYFTFEGIGVDNGGNGISIIQDLLTLDKYRLQGFEDRIRGFDFGGTTTIDTGDREMKKRTKEYMTALINGLLQHGQIKFPVEDSDIFDQFATQTYTLASGNVIYSKGNDHIIDATRCAVLLRELSKESNRSGGSGFAMPVVTEPVFV